MSNRKTFIDPLIDNNPITRQVLGICSALAVTVKVEQALVMTLALTFVVVMSNTIVSLLRKYIPSSIKLKQNFCKLDNETFHPTYDIVFYCLRRQ